jgi:hypothetical protein
LKTDRIDFISSYCDRWCERCAFTARCSTFAAQAAIAMCGDEREGLELALGEPHPVDLARAPRETPEWLADLGNVEPTAEEYAEFDRQEEHRHAHIEDTAIMKLAHAFTGLASRWLTDRRESVLASSDAVLKEAFEVASHDVYFISAKLYRALSGRSRLQSDDDDDHPVQNDWNGSAKVALISLERSDAAWRLIAQASGDDTPLMLADLLADLRGEVEKEFPAAWSFIRPGFDQANEQPSGR